MSKKHYKSQKHYKTNEQQRKQVSQTYGFGRVFLNIVDISLSPIRLLRTEGIKTIKHCFVSTKQNKKQTKKTPLLQTESGQILSEQDSKI